MPKKRPMKKISRRPQPPTKAGAFTLPTEPSKPVNDLRGYISMFFGQPGVGKTTFVNSLGRVLFLSTDRGTRFMEALRVECFDWMTFEKVVTELKRTGNAADYDYIAVDHVDDWARLCEMHVCEKLGIDSLSDADWGKGWSTLRGTMFNWIAEFKALNVGVVFIAHEQVKTIEVAGLKVDRVIPRISKAAWDNIVPLCDLIGYCGMKPAKDPKTKKRIEVRSLETEPRRDLFAKDRTDRNRPTDRTWEPLDGQKFLATFGA